MEQEGHRPLLLVEDGALEDFSGTDTPCETESLIGPVTPSNSIKNPFNVVFVTFNLEEGD